MSRTGAAKWWLLLVVHLWSLVVPQTMKAAEAAQLEYRVKAGYLYNFGKFVDWPESRMGTNDSPFVIGVIDGDGAVPVMQPVLAGKKIQNRTVQLKALSSSDIDSSVHILFVTRSSGKTPAEIQGALAGAPVLVVGETELFAEEGGAVGFVREKENIKLTLNLEAAARAGLKVSSKLSSVSKVVKDQGVKSQK